MAYLPVDFDLHDFQLNLNAVQSAKFHKRLKELGFDSHQQGDTLTYGRGKSRITAFVQNGAELNFLPDFFDDTPGGTVYAIMEKMCVAFGGTMIGQYSVPSLGKTWDVRVSQGMNLSGRPDVGQRDTVVDEDDGSTPSFGPSAPKSKPAQQKAAQATPAPVTQQAPVGNGEVQSEQSGESSRDKLYRVFVEEQYKKHVEANGEDPTVLIGYIKAFNEQFPKEEEKEQAPETQIDGMILDALYKFVGVDRANPLSSLANDLVLLISNGEEVVINVADQYGFGEDEVEEAVELLVSQHLLNEEEDDEDIDDEDFWEDEEE